MCPSRGPCLPPRDKEDLAVGAIVEVSWLVRDKGKKRNQQQGQIIQFWKREG